MTTADARLREIGKALHGTDQEIDFAAQEGTIRKILRLVAEKDVLVLGHNYMAPLVYQISGAEFRGDSLQLSRKAAESNRKIILLSLLAAVVLAGILFAFAAVVASARMKRRGLEAPSYAP